MGTREGKLGSEIEKVRGQSKREEGRGSERLEKAGQSGFPFTYPWVYFS